MPNNIVIKRLFKNPVYVGDINFALFQFQNQKNNLQLKTKLLSTEGGTFP